MTLPVGKWPELLPFLHACSQVRCTPVGSSGGCEGASSDAALSQHADELQRELALVVFLSLTGELGDILRPHFGTLATVFAAALGDSSPLVRTAAVRAVGALAAQVQSPAETAAVAALVPGMIAVCRAALAAGDEDCAGLLFSVLDDMVESPAPLLAGSLPAVVELVVGVATDARLSSSIRASALGLVAWMAQYKPRTLLKLRLVAPLLGTLCPLCADVYSDEAEEEDEERVEAEAVPAIACQALDAMATKLPSKHVLPTVLAFASANLNAAEPAARRAGLSALAYAVEGCAGALRPQAAELAPFAAAALRDPTAEVRTAAALVLGQLAEHCSPAVLDAHASVMPALLNALAESPTASAKRILYALDTWMDCLESEDRAFPRYGYCGCCLHALNACAIHSASRSGALPSRVLLPAGVTAGQPGRSVGAQGAGPFRRRVGRCRSGPGIPPIFAGAHAAAATVLVPDGGHVPEPALARAGVLRHAADGAWGTRSLLATICGRHDCCGRRFLA